MPKQSTFNLGVRAWLLLPLSIIGLCVICWSVGQRWQMLHGVRAAAVVQMQLGKEGSGSSGVYHIVVKYQQPQGRELFGQVATSRSTHNELVPGTPVQVCYAEKKPRNALLASEWSFSGKLMLITAVSLWLFFGGIGAAKDWRNRRRDGYLPE